MGSTKPAMDSKSKNIGYGKLILFGEHFVVYKVPALVAAVKASTSCKVELSTKNSESEDGPWSTGLIVEDNRPAVPGYKRKKRDEMLEATNLVLKHFKVDTKQQGVKITLGGDLCAVSGIGASASNAVSLSRALADALGLKLTEEEINRAGYEGEKGYHGTPSGIDNTAATYGGVLSFCRTDKDPIFQVKKLPSPCRIVYASTGITSSTTKVVGDVKNKKDQDPAWFDKLMTGYKKVYAQAEKALEAGDWKKVGELANENHKLLQDLTVSCKELDTLVDAARKAGAVGAKMAGTGRGGLMWAICLDSKAQDAVYDALSKIAPQVWKTEFA
mmetsp:Transcript_22744/g.44337  ORF Transcript_22744/g.44337 Transcript_22744/m.44337 type:complete len:330 (-) Transcript_22744:96-1085(-)